jgi:hypothetical protein
MFANRLLYRTLRLSVAMALRCALLTGCVLLFGCASTPRGAATIPAAGRDAHGAIWKFFHPAYLDGAPLWGKILFWAGPGH